MNLNFFRRTGSLDVEVNASGFSKEIQEFDKVLSEMNQAAAEEQAENGDVSENDEGIDENNNMPDNFDQETEEKYAHSIVNSEEAEETSVVNVDSQKNEKTQKQVEATSSKVDRGDEDYDKFDENIHMMNKQFRPYRDKTEGEGYDDSASDDDDNYSTTSMMSTIMDPKMVRSKVKHSLLKKMKQEKRRIRNKGESALVTERNREVNDTIKSSLGFF